VQCFFSDRRRYIVRQILQVRDNIFSNRPANIAAKYLTYDHSDIAFAYCGPF